jgi:hypothetical protein
MSKRALVGQIFDLPGYHALVINLIHMGGRVRIFICFFLALFSFSIRSENFGFPSPGTDYPGAGSGVNWPYNFPLSTSSEMARAYGEYLTSVGEYRRLLSQARLEYARSLLVEAQTRYQEWQTRALGIYVKRLELEVNTLRREENISREKIRDIENRGVSLKLIATGRLSAYTFRAFDFLVIHAVPPDVLVEVMKPEVASLEAENFIANHKQDDIEPFPGGNVGKLFRFLQVHNYSLEPWSTAHLIVLEMLGALSKVADDKIQRLRVYMEQIRAGTFDIWNPPGASSYPRPPQPGG